MIPLKHTMYYSITTSCLDAKVQTFAEQYTFDYRE